MNEVTKNILIALGILLVTILMVVLFVPRETDADRVVEYQDCYQEMLSDYLRKIKPVVDACSVSNDPVCWRVVNENVEKVKLQADSVCRVYLNK